MAINNKTTRWLGLWRGRLWWLVAIPVLLLAAYVVVARQLMLLVPDYREQLETLVEERFGVAIQIEQLQGSMDGLWPRFQLRGLTLPATEGESPLTLERVELSVRVLPTLLYRKPYLRELLIDGVDVHLVRDEQGRIRLRGLEALQRQRQETALEDALRTLYHQQRIVIQNARFSLDWPGLPPLAASSLNLALLNDGDEHALSVRVQARDRPFSVDARLRVEGEPLALEQVNADGYLDVHGERLQEWLPTQRQWPLDVARLDGRVRLWTRIQQGRPSDATVSLASPNIELTDGEQRWPVNDVKLDAAVHGLAGNGERQLSLTTLTGTTPAGAVAPGPVALRWRAEGEQRHWRAHGEDLAVHALTQQLAQWPFPLPAGLRAAREQLRAQDPRGLLQSVYLSGVDGTLRTLQARFAGLSMDAKGKIPGVSGVTGWIAGTPAEGVARLQGEPLQLTLTRFYDHPLSATFNGPMRWRMKDDGWRVDSGTLMAQNSDARGVAMLSLRGGGESVPELRLMADVLDGDGARARQYIPLKKLPDGLSDWLGQAVRDGHLQHGRFLYRGPVKIDPDQQQERTFQMRFQGSDIALSFLPGWPLAGGVNADVLIDGRQVSASASQGQLLNSRVSAVSVDVPDVDDKNARHIVIQGQVEGPASDLNQLFQDTPLKQKLPDELLDWGFQKGRMNGHLLLDMPLAKEGSVAPMVIVDGQASDVTLNNAKRKLLISHVSAPVYFHLKKGITLRSVKGDALGGHFEGSWLTRGPDSQMQLTGSVPAQRLREWLGFDWLSPVSGTLPLELDLGMPWQGSPFRLEARSTLKGVAVKAPAPLGKSASQVRGSQLSLSTRGGGGEVRFSYGDLGQGRVRLGQPLAGAIRFGDGALPGMPARGLAIEGRANTASAADWIEFVTGLMPATGTGAPGGGAQQGSGGRDLINRVALTVGRLDLFGVPLDDVRFSAAPAGAGWELGLASPLVAGTLTLPDGYQARGDKPLTIRVDRLRASDELVQAATGKKPEQAGKAGPPIAPVKVPILDADLRNLNIGGVDYGNWAGQVRPTAEGVVVHNLRGQWRHVAVNGELTWTGQEQGAQRSRFQGNVSSNDLAAAFKAFQLPELLETNDANAKVDLAWDNWPLKPDYLALNGDAGLKIGECRIPEMDRRTSFLRVLGVLNIGTLQRRLRLDFSDLYKKGLSCDSITGRFAFNGPALQVSELKIDSPSAEFEVNGQMNLARQSLDQRVKMTLPISSNLYAGCLAGPAVCAGIFVVERLWGDKLDKTTSVEYRVSGPWKDPQVKEASPPAQ
ncbi:TIGR02099 family protein [Alcanivorax sp. N3-2A]|nr:TIGR02099 family protein [Alcanivorax sp. N3-2A]|tara:strand:- start:2471 stop:6343 length:3873 start_codon:yes stop_codon:yes gene_type:complete